MSGRRRPGQRYSAEDQALSSITREVRRIFFPFFPFFSLIMKYFSYAACIPIMVFVLCVIWFAFVQAESRLQARSATRAEARSYRMKELEEQQKKMTTDGDGDHGSERSYRGSSGLPLSSSTRPRHTALSSTYINTSRRGSYDTTADGERDLKVRPKGVF